MRKTVSRRVGKSTEKHNLQSWCLYKCLRCSNSHLAYTPRGDESKAHQARGPTHANSSQHKVMPRLGSNTVSTIPHSTVRIFAWTGSNTVVIPHCTVVAMRYLPYSRSNTVASSGNNIVLYGGSSHACTVVVIIYTVQGCLTFPLALPTHHCAPTASKLPAPTPTHTRRTSASALATPPTKISIL